MSEAPEHDVEPLPADLIQVLGSLGDVQAPQELRDRVELARLEQEAAPAELWARVAPEVAAAGAAREGAAEEKRGALLFFRPAALRTAAAALVLAGGAFLWLDPFGEKLVFAPVATEAEKAEFRRHLQEMPEDAGGPTQVGRDLVGLYGAEDFGEGS